MAEVPVVAVVAKRAGRAALVGWGNGALRAGMRARTIDLGGLPRGVEVLTLPG